MPPERPGLGAVFLLVLKPLHVDLSPQQPAGGGVRWGLVEKLGHHPTTDLEEVHAFSLPSPEADTEGHTAVKGINFKVRQTQVT